MRARSNSLDPIGLSVDSLKSEASECMHDCSTRVLLGSLLRSGISLRCLTAEETPKM